MTREVSVRREVDAVNQVRGKGRNRLPAGVLLTSHDHGEAEFSRGQHVQVGGCCG
jgi:hypothetical protein